MFIISSSYQGRCGHHINHYHRQIPINYIMCIMLYHLIISSIITISYYQFYHTSYELSDYHHISLVIIDHNCVILRSLSSDCVILIEILLDPATLIPCETHQSVIDNDHLLCLVDHFQLHRFAKATHLPSMPSTWEKALVRPGPARSKRGER